MSELKPCPFCGGEAKVRIDYSDCGRQDDYLGMCAEDHCETEGPWRKSEAEAIAAWNQRPTPEPTESGEVDRVLDRIIDEYGRQTGDELDRHVLLEALGRSGVLSPPPQSQDRERDHLAMEKLRKEIGSLFVLTKQFTGERPYWEYVTADGRTEEYDDPADAILSTEEETG